jgi:hypothetical protein
MFRSYLGPLTYRATKSKSGNTHVYVTLPEPLPVFERIALQAILGSDAKREMLNFIRAKRGDSGEPILMYEVPKAA